MIRSLLGIINSCRSQLVIVVALLFVSTRVSVQAFTVASPFGHSVQQCYYQNQNRMMVGVQQQRVLLFTATEAVEVPTPSTDSAEAESTAAAASTSIDNVEIPTNLPSECNMDYVPLATMLATGQFQEADQVRFSIFLIFTKHTQTKRFQISDLKNNAVQKEKKKIKFSRHVFYEQLLAFFMPSKCFFFSSQKNTSITK